MKNYKTKVLGEILGGPSTSLDLLEFEIKSNPYSFVKDYHSQIKNNPHKIKYLVMGT